MPDKNDYSVFSIESKNALLQAEKGTMTRKTKTAGRKPKPVPEKQSEMIGLRFTKAEIGIIKRKAGLVPIATYIKNDLYTKTDLFNS